MKLFADDDSKKQLALANLNWSLNLGRRMIFDDNPILRYSRDVSREKHLSVISWIRAIATTDRRTRS